ncbi:hypothetical protein F5B20DRAFT_587359 [Whalleya microplaca]|nr:hypothetical protein F5B20DRAFT_587359 [Whalleya microplaca]
MQFPVNFLLAAPVAALSMIPMVQAVSFATICSEPNLAGTCSVLQGGNNVCTNLGDIGFDNLIGSIEQFDGASCSFWLYTVPQPLVQRKPANAKSSGVDCKGDEPIKGAKGTKVINPQGGDYRALSSARCTRS